jgi:hypothetical protein
MNSTKEKIAALIQSGFINQTQIAKKLRPTFTTIQASNFMKRRKMNPDGWKDTEVKEIVELFTPFFTESEVDNG